MEELHFLESKHIYLLDGEPIPCVSDLCRFLHREIYKDAPTWKMEEAAIRGTSVHAALQALDTTGAACISSQYLPYLSAYKAFLREHTVNWSMVEAPVYHPKERYAGTIDRYGIVDGFLSLVDFKTTYAVYKPICRAQINLYRMILLARGIQVDRMYILHLRRDGSYKLISFPEDIPLAQSLITLHNALRKRRKRGKPNV